MPLRLKETFRFNAMSVRRLNKPDEEQDAPAQQAPKSLSKKGSQKAADNDGQSADTTEEKD